MFLSSADINDNYLKVEDYEPVVVKGSFSGGVKFDSDKTPLELLDVDVLESVADVLKFGAKKYAAENWRSGIAYSRVFGATLRHLFAWARGETYDKETGLPHLSHAICELMFLLSFELDGRVELDDIYKRCEKRKSDECSSD